MNKKPLPIGTKIKYIGACPKCNNKIGIISRISYYKSFYNYRIYLPTSACCKEYDADVLAQPSEIVALSPTQLLFDFMYET